MGTRVVMERCQECRGSGEVPTGYTRFASAFAAWMTCRSCKGTGKVPVMALTPDPEPGTLEVGGYTVLAPTFRSADQFDRAIQRAFNDGVRVEATDRADLFLVSNPASTTAYTTGRTSCTCKAGQTETPCKHIARVIFELDIVHGVQLQEVA